MAKADLPEERRRELFKALVEAQDAGMPVEESRRHLAKQFGVTPAQVRRIETEGMDQEWPPL